MRGCCENAADSRWCSQALLRTPSPPGGYSGICVRAPVMMFFLSETLTFRVECLCVAIVSLCVLVWFGLVLDDGEENTN